MNPPDSSTANGIGQLLGGFILVSVIISIAALVFAIIIYWRIASKAGYNGALSLLLLVPIANLVLLIIFAFSEWPIQKELNQLRQQLAMGRQQYAPNPQYPQAYQQPQQYPQNSPQ